MYIVIERDRKFNNEIKGVDFISEMTNGLNEMWITSCGLNVIDLDDLKPLLFENHRDAVKYKNAAQLESNKDWNENRHVFRRFGDNKPRWSIEEFKGIKELLK